MCEKWKIVPFSEGHGREICKWTYLPPYDIYNWPSWEQMVQEEHEFADPKLRQEQYSAILDEEGLLCGFVQFFPIIGVTRLGLGLHPGLCGQGKGTAFVQLLAWEARHRAPDNEIDLEVFTWNERAIKTYQAAGFTVTDTYERMTPSGTGLFHCMVYSEDW